MSFMRLADGEVYCRKYSPVPHPYRKSNGRRFEYNRQLQRIHLPSRRAKHLVTIEAQNGDLPGEESNMHFQDNL